MALTQPPDVLKLLAHDVRWSLVQALNVSDYRVHELVEQLDAPMNLLSYHLKLLREGGFVTMHKSEADGRDVYYSLETAALHSALAAVGQSLIPSIPNNRASEPTRVLFVCTHNSARSQMAEALLRSIGGEKFAVFSAGSEPSTVHPEAVKAMQALNIDIRNQQAKHWSMFAGQQFDYVISVCDRARESCPVFPNGLAFHWSFPDPAAIPDAVLREVTFNQMASRIATRVEHFVAALRRQAAA